MRNFFHYKKNSLKIGKALLKKHDTSLDNIFSAKGESQNELKAIFIRENNLKKIITPKTENLSMFEDNMNHWIKTLGVGYLNYTNGST